MRADGDPELDQLRAVLHAWREHAGGKAVLVRDLLEELPPDSELRTALDDAAAGKGSLSARIGYYLRRHRGRIVDGLRLERGVRGPTGYKWSVVVLQEVIRG